MGSYSGRVIKKWLALENEIDYDEKCSQCVFSKCRNIKPKSLNIYRKITKCNWQIGFFDADGEVYFDKITIGGYGKFSSIIRNYWWNGKEGDEKKKGYYSLIKSVKQLTIRKQHINDLVNYMEGRYKVGKHQRLHKLDRNIELKIDSGLEETALERLQKYFDNILYDEIIDNLKTVNNITCDCQRYKFKNCKGVVPQKLVINAFVEKIGFYSRIFKEIHIPEIVMEEKADLRSIIQDDYGHGKYSLLHHVQTLIIRNNPNVLCDLMDYINGKYKVISKNDGYFSIAICINQNSRLLGSNFYTYNYPGYSYDEDDWKFYKLNKNIKIVIEKPGIAFNAVKEISDYFADVLIDNNKPEQYLAKQQPYQKQFQEHFGKYDLETDQTRNLILASQELRLEDGKLNVRNSSRKIDKLHVNQKLTPQQFVCFHDTCEPVIINEIVIWGRGDLRCVLQNTYYNGTDSGFFSLLWTVKELTIHNYQNEDSQVLVDLANYIEGKYVLNTNWKQEELNTNIRINNDNFDFFLSLFDAIQNGLSLSVTKRLRNYFRNVFIDCIGTSLETENVINQECENKYVFDSCRNANPQKLVVNAKLRGNKNLILFNDADCEVCIPEIMIGEHGRFDAIVRNQWWNGKRGNELKHGYYSLISHVKTLTIQNNPEAVRNLDSYVSEDYWVQSRDQEAQNLRKNIIVRINDIKGLTVQIKRLKEYFGYIVIDNRKALGSQRRGAIANIKFDDNKIQQQSTANADKRSAIARADAEIAETRQRIERARAKLRMRRARFQEYLALAE